MTCELSRRDNQGVTRAEWPRDPCLHTTPACALKLERAAPLGRAASRALRFSSPPSSSLGVPAASQAAGYYLCQSHPRRHGPWHGGRLKKNFASNFSLVSLDAKGPRHARSVIHLPLFTLPQHTRRELETTPGHKTQQPPSPGILAYYCRWDCTCGPVSTGDGEPSMARRPAGTPAVCAW